MSTTHGDEPHDAGGGSGVHGPEPQPIEVILPARLEMAAMLRLICAQLGAEAGLSLDEVDDLRLGAVEVFSSAIDAEAAERISATFEHDDGWVSALFFALGPARIDLDDLAERILRSGMDEVELTAGTVRFVKRTSGSSDDE